MERRIGIVDVKAAELSGWGASVGRRDQARRPDLPRCHARPGRQRVLHQLKLKAEYGTSKIRVLQMHTRAGPPHRWLGKRCLLRH